MKKYFININQYEFLIDKFPEILKKFSGKTLILSFIQEDRSLEKKLKISDEIIYDNSDYINGTVGFAKAIMDIDGNIEILPSSYKMKQTSFDFNKILEELDEDEYEILVVLFDDKMEIKNVPDLSSKEELKEIFDEFNIEESSQENVKEIDNKENHNEEENEIKEDDKDETITQEIKEEIIKEKISIFEKIKRLFRKNG